MEMIWRNSPAARNRALSSGSAMALAFASCAVALPASAQSIQGTPTVPIGEATVLFAPGTHDITVNAPQTVIDWDIPGAPGGGTIDILPDGTTTNFLFGTDLPDDHFIVLNRFFPTSAGSPTGQFVAINGAINAPDGGEVWLFSPDGLIIGPTAQINVGSFIATVNDIDTAGGLLGPDGEVRFSRTPDSLGFVDVLSGALINATSPDSAYVGLIAPLVTQSGQIQADGSIAYVAAEGVSITFNTGLLDIAVTEGTTDSNGVIHEGDSTGPASGGASDIQQLAIVAVPKNEALTMLLSGTFGYTPADSATIDGSSVVLSAGRGLGFDSDFTTSGLGNIELNDSLFTSRVDGFAGDVFEIAPDEMVEFGDLAQIFGANEVNVFIDTNTSLIGDTVTLASTQIPPEGDGGSITVLVNGTGGSPPGTIDIAGTFRLVANSGNVLNEDFPDNTGGSIDVALQGGTINALQLAIQANGTGTDTGSDGGSGTGGAVVVHVNADSVIDVDIFTVEATGEGSPGDLLANQNGGAGLGGEIDIQTDGGSILTQLFSLDASATGGNGTTSAGDAKGGNVIFNTNPGLSGEEGVVSISSSTSLSVNATGGDSDGAGGSGEAGFVSFTNFTGAMDLGEVLAQAVGTGGNGNSGPGGDGIGGSLDFDTVDTSLTATAMDLRTDGEGGTGTTTGLGTAGRSSLGLDGAQNGASFLIDGPLTVTALGTTDLTSGGLGIRANAGTVSIAGIGSVVSSAPVDFDVIDGGQIEFDSDLAITASQIQFDELNGNGAPALNVAGSLDLDSTGQIFVRGKVVGAEIMARSSDITFNPFQGQLGERGTTTSITLNNRDPAIETMIGSGALIGAYSIDEFELANLFADEFIEINTAPGSGIADMRIGDFSLEFGDGGNIGVGGTLLINTMGNILIDGTAALTTLSTAETLVIKGAEIVVNTSANDFTSSRDSGRLLLRDANGARSGTLDLTADSIAIATDGILTQLDGATSTSEIIGFLDVPSDADDPPPYIEAGAIRIEVTDEFLIQNGGATNEFADRLGFSAQSLEITTGSADTLISINGVIVDGTGTTFAGLDTAGEVLINGSTATGTGSFDPLSTINGCQVGTVCSGTPTPPPPPPPPPPTPPPPTPPPPPPAPPPTPPPPPQPGVPSGETGLRQPEIQEKVDTEDSPSGSPTGSPREVLPGIEIRENEEDVLLPLVDEPVTGVGNDDLWEANCDGDSEQCGPGEGN